MSLHNKIQERKQASTPISYSSVSVDKSGSLTERVSQLDRRIVEGYSNIWGIKNDRGEIFKRGAWSKSINELGPKANSNYKIKFRDNHGRVCAPIAELEERELGLYFKTNPLDPLPHCDELIVQLRSGSINNFSNGFRHVWEEGKIEWDDKQEALIINEARLFEISAVPIPSDLETFVMRSAEELENLTEDVEEFIITLPRQRQLDARKIITRCMTLGDTEEQLELRRRALANPKPSETGLDFNYLISNLKKL